MQGEILDWIKDKNGGYKWVPNVTGPENTPDGWTYVGKTGSYRIDGAIVQLLDNGLTFTDIDDIAVSGSQYKPVLAAATYTASEGIGLFLFLAVATKIVIDDLFSRPLPTLQGIQIDPMMHSPQTLNSDAESDKDVNEQDVPKEQNEDGNKKTTKTERMQAKKISLLLIRNMEVVQSIQVMQEVHQRIRTKKGGLEIQKIKEVKKRILGDIEHRIRKKENNYNPLI